MLNTSTIHVRKPMVLVIVIFQEHMKCYWALGIVKRLHHPFRSCVFAHSMFAPMPTSVCAAGISRHRMEVWFPPTSTNLTKFKVKEHSKCKSKPHYKRHIVKQAGTKLKAAVLKSIGCLKGFTLGLTGRKQTYGMDLQSLSVSAL